MAQVMPEDSLASCPTTTDSNGIVVDNYENLPPSTCASCEVEVSNAVAEQTTTTGKDKDDSSDKSKRYLGILWAFVAALLYSLSALTIKEIGYHPYNLGVWRFICMIFITVPFLIHGQYHGRKVDSTTATGGILKHVWPLNRTTGLLVLQAILGSNSIMFVFYGLHYLGIGDSIVISTSAPVFVTVVACIFLRERCGFVPVATALFAMVGVGIICKPPILTGGKQLDMDTVKGVIFSLAAMILLTFCYVLVRSLREVHHALIQFTFAVCGLLESAIIGSILGVLQAPASWREAGLVVTNTLLAFSAQTSLTIALKYEQAGVVALVRTTEVVFAYFWGALFLDERLDIFSVIGAVITIFCVIVAGLRKTVESLPDGDKCKKMFRFLLL